MTERGTPDYEATPIPGAPSQLETSHEIDRRMDPSAQTTADPSVVLSAEQVVMGTEWVESGHVRLRRRIVSATRTMEVVVRREELVVEVRDAAFGQVGESYVGIALGGAPVDAPPAPAGPVVLLLREEIPELVMRTQVYEQITAEVILVEEMAVWHDTVRVEQAVTEAEPNT